MKRKHVNWQTFAKQKTSSANCSVTITLKSVCRNEIENETYVSLVIKNRMLISYIFFSVWTRNNFFVCFLFLFFFLLFCFVFCFFIDKIKTIINSQIGSRFSFQSPNITPNCLCHHLSSVWVCRIFTAKISKYYCFKVKNILIFVKTKRCMK